MASEITKKFEALSLFSVALALLYVSGFFVHLGESHLLGVNLPIASQLEYLVLGGDFLFQSLQAMLRPFLTPPSPWWISLHFCLVRSTDPETILTLPDLPSFIEDE